MIAAPAKFQSPQSVFQWILNDEFAINLTKKKYLLSDIPLEILYVIYMAY